MVPTVGGALLLRSEGWFRCDCSTRWPLQCPVRHRRSRLGLAREAAGGGDVRPREPWAWDTRVYDLHREACEDTYTLRVVSTLPVPGPIARHATPTEITQ